MDYALFDYDRNPNPQLCLSLPIQAPIFNPIFGMSQHHQTNVPLPNLASAKYADLPPLTPFRQLFDEFEYLDVKYPLIFPNLPLLAGLRTKMFSTQILHQLKCALAFWMVLMATVMMTRMLLETLKT